MRRLPAVALLPGCVWLGTGELEDRLDRDGDGVPGSVDCNDDRPEVSELEADFALACGDVIAGDLADGADVLEVANCTNPFDEEDLLVLGRHEHVYRFSSDVPVDVEVELLADDLWLAPGRDEEGVALVANRGARCGLDACVVGLPGTAIGDPADRPEPWRPSVRFHAAAAEAWFVVASGGRPGVGTAPYAIEVRCEE